jgi:cytochrome c oxidase subunit II
VLSKTSLSSSQVDLSFFVITSACVALFLLIVIVMLYFVIKYEKKRNPVSTYITENATLEIVWTVLPTILVLGMFFYGSEAFTKIRNAPPDAIPVTVTGKQWEWSFVYVNQKESKVLVAPVNTPILLHLRSVDVVHSFYVPAFKIKEDAVPGLNNYLWFEAREKGTYDALCSEYCGLGHSKMIAQVVIVDKDIFEKWLTSSSDEGVQTASTLPGFKPIREHGCIGCHTTDGSNLVGPSFKGLYGKRLGASTGAPGREVTIDDAFIRDAIHSHGKDAISSSSSTIPPLGIKLSEQEIEDIIHYLRSLQKEKAL